MIGEILAAVSLLVVVFISFLSLRKMNRFDRLIPDLDNLIGHDDAGHIVMDERIVAVIDAVGSRLFQSAKMSMLQGLSVDSKLEKGLNEAMSLDIIEEKFPLLDAGAGILKDMTGYNVKKYITKNPKAVFQIIGMAQKAGINLSSFMGNNGAQGPSQSRSRM